MRASTSRCYFLCQAYSHLRIYVVLRAHGRWEARRDAFSIDIPDNLCEPFRTKSSGLLQDYFNDIPLDVMSNDLRLVFERILEGVQQSVADSPIHATVDRQVSLSKRRAASSISSLRTILAASVYKHNLNLQLETGVKFIAHRTDTVYEETLEKKGYRGSPDDQRVRVSSLHSKHSKC
jgi:hypothetical protein